MVEETSQQSRFKLLRKDGFARWQALSTWYRTKWRESRLFRLGNYLAAAVLVGWFVLWVAVLRTLPSADSLLTYQPPLPTMVRGNDGEIVSSYARERRVQLRFVDFPEPLINAYLAAEDKTFWTHGGIDFFGLAGAVADYALKFGSGERARGGSTITQQVAKNILIGDEYSISRKLKEMILARRIEGVLEKQQILELYLNEIPLGRQSFGVQAASRAYFDKDVGELQLHEAAFLAILPKAPERYGRAKYESMAIERRNWVLDQMVSNGWATPQAAAAAQAMPLGLKPRRAENYTADAGYFLEEVRRQLISKFGEKAENGPNSVYAGGLWVRTSLDTQLQTAAQNSLRTALLRYSGGRGWHGPIARVDVSGDRWQTELITSNISVNYQNWRVGVLLSRSGSSGKIGFSDGTTADLVSLPDKIRPGDITAVAPLNAGTYAVRTIPEVSGGMVVEDPQSGRVLA
ncbi:MAG: penicillin-binding protein, partial [Novosphingobium sp. 35-62-5]